MIEIKDICFSYGSKSIIENINVDVQRGECVAVLGNNGAGKSTFITCLNKIRNPKSGSVHIDGRDIFSLSSFEIAKNISYVPQHNEMSKTTVYDAVLLGRKPYIKWTVSNEDFEVCNDIISKLDLEDFKLRYIDELSGGEVQKVMLARALVQEPKLLLLDEPTSNLDLKNQHEMLKIVTEVAKKENIGVLLVIHDLNLALRYCDKFLFIKDGTVHKYGDEGILSEEVINEVYGVNSKLCMVDGHKVVIVE